MTPPTTPTPSSIRNFKTRTSITPTTLARTTNTSNNTSTGDFEDEIISHLKDNLGTPTRVRRRVSLSTSTSIPTSLTSTSTSTFNIKTPQKRISKDKDPKQIDPEEEEEEKEFTPVHPLPSSVTLRKRPYAPTTPTSPLSPSITTSTFLDSDTSRSPAFIRNQRRRVGIYEYTIPNISDSIEEMGYHTGYNFRSTSSSISKISPQSSEKDTEDIEMTEATPESEVQEETQPQEPTSNKENVDPKPHLHTPSTSRTLKDLSTPPPPNHSILYSHARTIRQKDIFSQKKLEGMRNTHSTSTAIPRLLPPTTTTWSIPRSTPSNTTTTTTTTTTTPTQKPHPRLTPPNPPYHFTLPPPKTGLTSKLGLQTHKKKPSNNNNNNNKNYTTSTSPDLPTPCTPTPQKLLHKSAKSSLAFSHKMDYSYHFPTDPTASSPSLFLRSAKVRRVEDLKVKISKVA
ncbi:hypothetical protein TWF718_005028 [Orbilia javanica]|uniref:Uncharacterized protein n=1 Tax=Orbilia javanica TaxID=47235 RepID=A0AAN8N6S1_9PEZI